MEIKECSWCNKKATVTLPRDNCGSYCDDCYAKGLEEEKEVMGYYDN